PAQLLQGDLKLVFGGQGNGARIAPFEADFAAGETAKWMRHDRPAALGVPIKNIVRTEVEALEVGTAGVRVNGGKPREFLAKMAQQGHSQSFMNRMNNQTGYSPQALNGAACWDRQALSAARGFGPGYRHWWHC